MKTTYLGLELSSPVIVSSSPYTATVPQLEQCARHGAGAAVLKSIFEEQILHQAEALGRHSDSTYGDADLYLQRYLGDDYKTRVLELIRSARTKTDLPLIASINCVGTGDVWIEYAEAMAEAGASALELNIFFHPTDPRDEAGALERRYTEIVAKVVSAVRIPVSVKLPRRLTNVYNVAQTLWARGARGAVLYNRFFEPEVDVERLAFVEGSPYSDASELRNLLRTSAIFTSVLPQLDLSVSTGVHDGEAVVKTLLCGARAAHICTAIHLSGFEVIEQMNQYVDQWAARHGFRSIEEFRGRLNFREDPSPLCQRVQYMRYFPNTDELHEL